MIFFLYFGLPSIQRFQAREVMVVTSKRHTGGIPAPAITIAAMHPQTGIGWKRSSSNITFPHLIRPLCENTTSKSETIDGCIKENTYNQTEVVKDVLLGYTAQQSLLKDGGLWTEDFTWPWFGRTYTLDIENTIGLDEERRIIVAVGYDLNYKIFIHDPLYFAINNNPTTFPSIFLPIRPNETKSYYYRLTLTEVEELDLPEDPCNPDQDYNFNACIKEILSREVGCRTSWDDQSQLDRLLCTRMDQYR
jgi:hypothetical protein